MLNLGSLFWSTKNLSMLTQKFEKLGFVVSPSHRHPQNPAVFFGPDALELSEGNNDGVWAFEFDSDDIVNDYKALKKTLPDLPKPKIASKDNTPLWFGFDLPETATTKFKGGVVMDSPESMAKMAAKVLPHKHPNTCFGFESITCIAAHPEDFAKKWGTAIGKPTAHLMWNELVKTQGARVISGSKFIDCITVDSLRENSNVFMITFKVVDLELAKEICMKAGVKTLPCATRDGFIVEGTPHVRFVRAAWKEYLPQTRHNFPFYRREDKFRPLGGAYTSTLVDGFEDNWKY